MKVILTLCHVILIHMLPDICYTYQITLLHNQIVIFFLIYYLLLKLLTGTCHHLRARLIPLTDSHEPASDRMLYVATDALV